jgi:hypothetical protein
MGQLTWDVREDVPAPRHVDDVLFLLEFCNVVSYLDLDPWFLVDYKAPKSLERREDKFHVAVVLLDLLTRVLRCMF